MIDLETRTRLEVSTDGDAGPYLMVPLPQLPDVQSILRRNGVSHGVDEDAIQLDGHPMIAVVNFGRGTDARRIQDLLDDAE